VPSALKAWINHIVRIRRLFQSAPKAKIGLLHNRPIFVAGVHGA
jgi:FMN-dependent NADH-azoreductase